MAEPLTSQYPQTASHPQQDEGQPSPYNSHSGSTLYQRDSGPSYAHNAGQAAYSEQVTSDSSSSAPPRNSVPIGSASGSHHEGDEGHVHDGESSGGEDVPSGALVHVDEVDGQIVDAADVPAVPIEDLERPPQDDMPCPCPGCPMKYNRRQRLLFHGRLHGPQIVQMIEEKYPRKNVSTRVKCPICNELFKNFHTCRRHYQRKHRTTKDYACPTEGCGRTFSVESDWKEHMKSCVDKLFFCRCGNQFAHASSLKKHVRRGDEAQPGKHGLDIRAKNAQNLLTGPGGIPTLALPAPPMDLSGAGGAPTAQFVLGPMGQPMQIIQGFPGQQSFLQAAYGQGAQGFPPGLAQYVYPQFLQAPVVNQDGTVVQQGMHPGAAPGQEFFLSQGMPGAQQFFMSPGQQPQLILQQPGGPGQHGSFPILFQANQPGAPQAVYFYPTSMFPQAHGAPQPVAPAPVAPQPPQMDPSQAAHAAAVAEAATALAGADAAASSAAAPPDAPRADAESRAG